MSLLSNASTDFSDEDYIHYHGTTDSIGGRLTTLSDNKSFRLGRIRHFKDQDHDHNMTVVRRASTVRVRHDTRGRAALNSLKQTSTAQKRWLRSAMGEDVLEIKRLIREDPTLVNHRDIFSGYETHSAVVCSDVVEGFPRCIGQLKRATLTSLTCSTQAMILTLISVHTMARHLCMWPTILSSFKPLPSSRQ